MMLYIVTKFRVNILNGVKVIRANMISIPIIIKGHNFNIKLHEVTILVLCTLSVDALPLYLVS